MPPTYRRRLGDRGEKLAQAFLRSKGYKIIETNYRRREGEIDIIAQTGDCLVFVEVRTRRGSQFGTPEESLTETKQERLEALAQEYIQSHENLPPQWRIDVVAIELDSKGYISRIELIENAVEGKA